MLEERSGREWNIWIKLKNSEIGAGCMSNSKQGENEWK